MTCDFMSFSIVLLLYQDDGRMIMKGCVQWSPIYSCEDFARAGIKPRSAKSVGHSLNKLAFLKKHPLKYM